MVLRQREQIGPAPQTDGFVTSDDGVRIAWRCEGPADRLPLVLCSMGTAALAIWDGVAAQLAHRWRVIRHDRRGDGDSDPGPPESHSFATYAGDAVRVMDACGCRAAVVCGMAFGARVATRIALDHPERLLGLILFDATAGPPASEAERTRGSGAARRLRVDAGLPQTPFDRAWFARRDPAGAGLARRALAGHPPWTPGLETIRVPTLVACGDHDPNLEGARRLAHEIPCSSFAVMPMTGHGSLLDRPDLVQRLINRFLARLEGETSGPMTAGLAS
jgi:pimeloyl-ACP methyl ester carboxylesterase